jgi:hypothetical protein
MKVCFKKNYLKIVLFLVIFFLLFFFCLIAIQNPSKYVYFLLPSPIFVFILSLIGIIFFPYISYHLIGWLLKSKYGLVTNEKGISNPLYFLKVNFIEWEDIVSISMSQNSNEKRIKIIVKDYDKYLKGSDFLTQFLMKFESKNNTVVFINPYFLKVNREELYKTILNEWGKYYKIPK